MEYIVPTEHSLSVGFQASLLRCVRAAVLDVDEEMEGEKWIFQLNPFKINLVSVHSLPGCAVTPRCWYTASYSMLFEIPSLGSSLDLGCLHLLP